MSAGFHDFSMIEQDDSGGQREQGRTMSHHHGRAFVQKRPQLLNQFRFSERIQLAGGLVEQQQSRITKDRSGK